MEYCGPADELDEWCCCQCHPCALCIGNAEEESEDDD